MKKYLVLISCLIFVFAGCHRKDEPNKIIDGSIVTVNGTNEVAKVTKAMFLLKRDTVGVMVPIINRLTQPTIGFAPLVGPGVYTFPLTNPSYGTVSVSLTFKDASGATIDPIAAQSSTSSLKSVQLSVTGSSPYTISESLVLTLDTAGDTTSKKSLAGTSSFSGNGVSVNFTIPSPGAESTFQGLDSGRVTGSGTGSDSNPISVNLQFGDGFNADGAIHWSNQDGQIHMNADGTGYIYTNQTRLLL